MDKFLESFSKVLALGTSGVLSLAVMHELAYFYVIGWHFLTVMGAYDFLLTALHWLPVLIAFSVVLFLIQILGGGRAKETSLSEQASKRWFSNDFRANAHFHVIAILLALLGVFSFFSIPSDSRELPIVYFAAVAYAWYLVCLNLFKKTPRHRAYYAMWLIPVWGMIAFTYGIDDGFRDLRSQKTDYVIALKDDPAEKKVLVLRILDNGVLYKNFDRKRVEFQRWQEIKLLAVEISPTDSRSHGCRIIGFYCK
jgi:hypothetical protein